MDQKVKETIKNIDKEMGDGKGSGSIIWKIEKDRIYFRILFVHDIHILINICAIFGTSFTIESAQKLTISLIEVCISPEPPKL